jgi:hypothetical protein
MSKGLKALANIRREAGTPYFSTLYDIDMWREDFATIEKELKDKDKYFKAVDFLLENGLVDIGYDEEEGSYYINLNCGKILISDEEYNLWKEILCS